MNVGHEQAAKHNLTGTAEEEYCQKLNTALLLLGMERDLTSDSYVVSKIKESPRTDFSQGKDEAILFFAQVDAMVYRQAHKELKSHSFNPNDNDVGPAHALNHNLIGNVADAYTVFFSSALNSNAVSSDEQAASIKTIRDGGPTADFSQTTEKNYQYHMALCSLAEADAMVYFEDRKDLQYDSRHAMEVGKARSNITNRHQR